MKLQYYIVQNIGQRLNLRESFDLSIWNKRTGQLISRVIIVINNWCIFAVYVRHGGHRLIALDHKALSKSDFKFKVQGAY